MWFDRVNVTSRAAIAGAVLIGCGLSAGPADAAMAESRQISLKYEVHIAGIAGMRADTVVSLTDDRFVAEARVSKTGVLNALTKAYQAVHTSRGRLIDGRVVPDSSVAQVLSGDSARALRASYAADGTLNIAENPPFEPKPGREVGADKRVGAWDPLMAAIAAVLGRRDPCGATIPIFDGRNRFDLVMRRIGSTRLEPAAYGTVRGEATVCEVRMRKIAGYKDDTDPDEDMDNPARLWLGALDDTGRLFPLRVEVSTKFGTAVGHLQAMESRPLTSEEQAALAK